MAGTVHLRLEVTNTAAWWACQSTRFGIARPPTTYFLVVSHSTESIAALRAHAEALDDWHLAAFDSAANSLKSYILAAALLDGHLGPAKALAASRLEETYQQASLSPPNTHTCPHTYICTHAHACMHAQRTSYIRP